MKLFGHVCICKCLTLIIHAARSQKVNLEFRVEMVNLVLVLSRVFLYLPLQCQKEQDLQIQIATGVEQEVSKAGWTFYFSIFNGNMSIRTIPLLSLIPL